MRTIKLKSKKLVKILETRAEVLKEAREIQKEVEELQKVQQKLGYKMNKLKDKTTPLVKDVELEEFEVISTVKLEKGEVVVEIIDQIEEYKKALRERDEDVHSDKR